MEDGSPPGSPLSDLSRISSTSDPFDDEENAMASAPPAKRQKTVGEPPLHATPPLRPLEMDLASISSDSSGEIPITPYNGSWRPDDDEPAHEQITVCMWVGCNAGDLRNMDKLVEHIHNEHIEAKQKNKYTCQWSDCSRRSMPHASGYALKAHVRSHTREKPFYCALPECDRAFTRSDALAKHMRTVHETEALRPSDPIPRTMQQIGKARFRLIKPSDADSKDVNGEGAANGNNGLNRNDWHSSYPLELGITQEEEALGPVNLYRLLRCQVRWAEEEGESLRKQCEVMEEFRKKEWMEKEVLVDQVIAQEKAWHKRRKEALRGFPALSEGDDMGNTANAVSSPKDTVMLGAQTLETAPTEGLAPVSSQSGDQREAAAVLASLIRGRTVTC